MSRFLHVANGTCTTDLIQAAGIPGRISVWADVLYDGPVPADLDDLELLRLRARHLAGPAEGSYFEVKGLQRWRDAIDDVDSYDELVLWYEHDLFDQLNLIQLLSWMRFRLPATTTVSLVEIGSFPGRPAFKGLGELTPGELASLLEARQRVADERYAVAAVAWAAFRQPTPEPVDALRHAETGAMPFLNAALKRFLEEYPWTTDGLSRSERRLLTIASAGPVDLMTAFSRMHDGENAYYITDRSFLAILQDFSRSTPPLISITNASLDENRIPLGAVTITERGRAVLSGDLDRVANYGIDRWFGGVHLEGDGLGWRWNDAEQRIVRENLRT
jgi:hypothetical protein